MAAQDPESEYRRFGVIVAAIAIALVLAFAFGIPKAIEQSAETVHAPGPGPAAIDATPTSRQPAGE